MATDQTVIVLQVAHDLSGPRATSAHVVLDLSLEQQFALILETHPRAQAYAKNQRHWASISPISTAASYGVSGRRNCRVNTMAKFKS
jgi:hypothetical protein